MFKPNSIIKLNEQRDQINEQNRITERDQYSRLGFIDRTRINRLDKMINSIIKQIDSNSKWEYFHNSFIYKSNYRYDSKREDILFDINLIQRSNNGYRPNSNNKTELEFYLKFESLLERLHYLQSKKESIYREREMRVISFNSAKKISDLKRSKPFDLDFTLYMAKSFIDDYGIDGMRRLISLLKDSEVLSTEELYSKIRNTPITSTYKQDLLSWMGTYNKTGKSLLDRYIDDISPVVTWEKPNIEDLKIKYYFNL